MFNDEIIVQSAVSAFNNAALAAPAFLWWAILAVPVFFMAFVCRNTFMQKIGLGAQNLTRYAGLLTVMLTFGWIVLFGGNYSVLRDNVSVLPFMIAAIVFVCAMFVTSYIRNIPLFRINARGRRWMYIGLGLCLVLGLGLSDMHAWWGPILQIGAGAAGVVSGRMASREMRPIGGTVLVLMAVATAILMQPEFFRFGQLGNLTVVHLAFILALGGASAATVALYNINARGRIPNRVYVKLKWLMRFVGVLCAALFLLTESVPVFLGTTAVLFVMFAMSVWHSPDVHESTMRQMFAVTLGIYGVITVMPAIVVMAILCWPDVRTGRFWHDLRTLL